MTNKQVTSNNKFADVPVRVRSWGIIIIILSVALIHPALTCLFVCFLSFWGMTEYFSIIGIYSKKIVYLFYAIIPIQYYFSYTNEHTLFIYISLSSILAATLLYFFLFKGKQSLWIILAMLTCVVAIGHLSFIRNLDLSLFNTNGIKIFLLLVILTELNDVFQYLTGKFFGKRKITPKISPNKTVEGFLGGVILTTILANCLGLFLLPGKSIFIYSALGILISTLGFCGDLYMSFVKRTFGVKDTGNLIPGHGGMLDRIDSLIVVSPVYYWLICLFFP